MAKYDEKSKARTMKYMKEKRDKLTLNLPLGDKERFKAYAESKGKSLTALIIDLIEADMINEQKAAEPKKPLLELTETQLLQEATFIVKCTDGNEFEYKDNFADYVKKSETIDIETLDSKQLSKYNKSFCNSLVWTIRWHICRRHKP